MNPEHSISRRTRRSFKAAAILAASALALGLAACAPSGGTSGESSGGDRALIALVQEPGVLNRLFSSQSGSELSQALVQEPLFFITKDGEYEPWLAEEVPSLENGTISADGTVVTFKVKEGITWSDGEPFTAEDLAFTVEVIQNPESTTFADPEYAAIASTKVVDARTLEVTFSSPTPSFINLFQVTLPKHMFASSAVAVDDPQARLPLGTGPFVYTDWKSGDSISLDRNEHYWVDPELPKLDGVTVKIAPDREATLNGFANGEYDSVFFFTGADLLTLTQQEKDGAPIVTYIADEPWFVEWLWLNHSDHGDPATPHPVLGDPVIREAIDSGIDRQSIIDDVLGGFGSLTGSFIYSGVGAVQSDPTKFDPKGAMAALEAAGWKPGADGIREKDGVRASLKYQTIAGDHIRELYQQLIQQNLKEIGIELVIENVPSTRLFDSRDKGGLLANGEFDIAMSRAGYAPDPTDWVTQFTSSSIPSDANPNGVSTAFWSNPEFDALAAEASREMDPTKRAEILAKINDLFVSQSVAIPLYAGINGMAWSDRLTGIDTSSWYGGWSTKSTANWEVVETGGNG